jgi:aldose sugar dehydrogenase
MPTTARPPVTRREGLQLAGAWGLGLAVPAAVRAQTASKPVPPLRAARTIELARGLEHPWGLSFLPDGRMLVTERPGTMRLFSPDAKRSEQVKGVPDVYSVGQGGLLDIAVSPDFGRDNLVFLALAQPTARGARTAIVRAELQGSTLRNHQVIFGQRQDPGGGYHFGCRLALTRDGLLYAGLGDRYSQKDRAQDLTSHFGKVIRIRTDGSAPADNPFANTAAALPEIWSIGHRNIQGAALHPATGALWTHEHGAQGGDELNIPQAGKNYGWPVITWGVDYGGARIGEGTSKPGLEQPLYYWDPSIAPSGMAFVTSDRYPGWKGSLLVGSLKFRQLVRLDLDGPRVIREERLLGGLGERIRDIRQGLDGLLYVLTDSPDGKLLRIEPA